MSCFTQYKLKDGRKIKGRYDSKSTKVCISRLDLEDLIYEANVAYEQAEQLQTIIENLAEIKRQATTKVLDKIRAEIEQLPTKTRTNWDGCCPDIDYPEIEYVDVTKEQLLQIIDKS